MVERVDNACNIMMHTIPVERRLTADTHIRRMPVNRGYTNIAERRLNGDTQMFSFRESWIHIFWS